MVAAIVPERWRMPNGPPNDEDHEDDVGRLHQPPRDGREESPDTDRLRRPFGRAASDQHAPDRDGLGNLDIGARHDERPLAAFDEPRFALEAPRRHDVAGQRDHEDQNGQQDENMRDPNAAEPGHPVRAGASAGSERHSGQLRGGILRHPASGRQRRHVRRKSRSSKTARIRGGPRLLRSVGPSYVDRPIITIT